MGDDERLEEHLRRLQSGEAQEWVRDRTSPSITRQVPVWHAVRRRGEETVTTHCGVTFAAMSVDLLTPLHEQGTFDRCRGCVSMVLDRRGD